MNGEVSILANVDCRPGGQPILRAVITDDRMDQATERSMIQIVEGLPDNVVGIVAKGRVTNEDCNKVLKPLVQRSLMRHDKVRLYYEIGCRFPGAALEDLKIGMQYLPQCERVAVVTDVGWFRRSL